MIVGGYAVAFHGFPRFTGDIDIFFDSSEENISKLCEALVDFGFPANEIPLDVLRQKGEMLTFGVPPVRVDLMNDIDGVDYQEAKATLVRSRYGKTEVSFIGREELLKNKKSAKRAKDKADLEGLS
jgi:hypothetical protein